MPRNGSGVYSLPSGSVVANGDTSDASDLNTPLADIASDLNTARPIAAGGTGASSASAARTALGLAIGTDVQAYSADLAAYVAAPLTAAELAQLQNIGTVTISAAQWGYIGDISSFGASIIDDPDAAAVRGTLGLGTAAVEDAGVTAGDLVQLDGSGRLPAVDGSQLTNLNAGRTLLGTIDTTSGSSASLGSLTLTDYKELLLVVDGVSGDANMLIELESINVTGLSGGAGNALHGFIRIDLATGVAVGTTSVSGNNGDTRAANTSLSTASTSVTVSPNTGNFDAGSIPVWGIR